MRTRMTRKSFISEAGFELVRGCYGRIFRGRGKVANVAWGNSWKMSTQRGASSDWGTAKQGE